jgi:hypothetical protein
VTRRAAWWPAALALTYALMAVVLRPAYDWPVIDSWAFGYTVQQWLATGRFVFVDWGAMSLFAHAAWGALFCLPAGFSFAALNLSTFVLSLAAALATYLGLRELAGWAKADPAWAGWALLGALLLVVNPAFVLLSYSYMTDVPFLAWYSLAAWCDLRGLRLGRQRWLWLGAACAAVATLIRQNGVVLPAALAAYLLWGWLRRQRPFPARELLAALFLPAATLAALTALSRLGVIPSRTDALSWVNLGLAPAALAANLFRILLYLGLFALPLSAALLDLRRVRQAAGLAGLAALIGAGAVLQYFRPFKLPYLGVWRMMPYFPTVWTVFGTGGQEEWLAGARPMLFSYRFWVIITAVSCIGAALLLWPALRALTRRDFRSDGTGWPAGFLVLMGLVYLAPILLFRGEIYERYLIGLLLPIAGLLLRAAQKAGRRPLWPAFAALAAVFLAFSLALTAEFVAWNGAAWRAAGRLAAQGVPAEQIDGGFAWNGWQFAGQIGKSKALLPAGAPAYMELTPQITRQYVVSFSPLAGYTTIGREPYWSAFHWGERELLVLQRTGG